MNWNLNELKSKAAELLNNGNEADAKSKCREMFQTAATRASEMKESLGKKLNTAAEKVAETCTEWTGRETSAKDVKRVAIVGAAIGATVTAVAAMGPVGGVAARQVQVAARSLGQPTGMPSVTTDPSEAIEQDAVEYDQMQYDNLQDHLGHQDHLDSVIDDQISYGMDSYDV